MRLVAGITTSTPNSTPSRPICSSPPAKAQPSKKPPRRIPLDAATVAPTLTVAAAVAPVSPTLSASSAANPANANPALSPPYERNEESSTRKGRLKAVSQGVRFRLVISRHSGRYSAMLENLIPAIKEGNQPHPRPPTSIGLRRGGRAVRWGCFVSSARPRSALQTRCRVGSGCYAATKDRMVFLVVRSNRGFAYSRASLSKYRLYSLRQAHAMSSGIPVNLSWRRIHPENSRPSWSEIAW